MRLIRHDPRAKSIRFEIEVPQNAPYVAMKEDDLVLVLLNVIINAIERITRRFENFWKMPVALS